MIGMNARESANSNCCLKPLRTQWRSPKSICRSRPGSKLTVKCPLKRRIGMRKLHDIGLRMAWLFLSGKASLRQPIDHGILEGGLPGALAVPVTRRIQWPPREVGPEDRMWLLLTNDVMRPLDRGIIRQGIEQNFPVGRSHGCETAGHAGDLGIGKAIEQRKFCSPFLRHILPDRCSHSCAKIFRHGLPLQSGDTCGISRRNNLQKIFAMARRPHGR